MAHLLPFAGTWQLPAGTYDQLPLTRQGIRHLRPSPFVRVGPGYRELLIADKQQAGLCRGICGLLPATAFTDGTVRPHEKTLLARLDVQEALFRADGGAIAKPVLLTTPSLQEWWPRVDALDGRRTGDRLQFVGVNQEYLVHQLRTSGSLPLPAGPLVIADGHHRAETFGRLAAAGDERFARVPVVIIGARELRIGTFLRVVDVGDTPLTTFRRRLSPFFDIAPAVTAQGTPQPLAPERVGDWLLSYRGTHLRLRRRKPTADTDAGWLNEVVLPAVFGITDSRKDPRYLSIDPPPRPGGVLQLPEELHDRLLLYGFPLPPERFFAEVAAGRTLPPKSTRFEPRVPSGLIVTGGTESVLQS